MAETKTVLIVDDEAPLRQVTTEALQQAGYTVITATNGKEGLDLALAKHPDLVLSDNIMPLMNGIDMVNELRKDEWGTKVPIIIMTGINDIGSLNESLQAGITDYVMKADVGLDKLVELVDSRLKPSAG